MTLPELLDKYQELVLKRNAFSYADYLIGWDSETEAPAGCFENRSKMVGVLAGESFRLSTCQDTQELIDALYQKFDELDDTMKLIIKKEKRSIDQMKKIPEDEYIEYSMLMASAQQVWANAKHNNDFASFAPTLEKIVEFQKKLMKYLETDELKGYDVLLDQYEEGSTQKIYDEFFNTLKQDLVPFVLKVASTPLPTNKTLDGKYFSVDKQEELSKYLLDAMKFDWNRGVIKTSEHPFTSGFTSQEVRITTHYYTDNLLSSMYSVIHEGGHALYELQVDPKYDFTVLSGGSTMAMHESQSRFYENMIGRSKAYFEAHYPKIKELFSEELKDITLDDFYQLANDAKCSLIRTEADELTYPLHIMVRYEIEKLLLTDQIQVKDLPDVWNKMMADYLGVDVPNDTLGVLQDVHWAGGSFGYFPTYAYGSAISAQLYNAMSKEINIEEALKSGTTEQINNWLKEHVHQYGGSLLPNEILLKATGEVFNPKYYVNYLKEKYTSIYNIK